MILRPIRTANELWLPDYNTIVIRSGLRSFHQRTALAHGIAHADLGHEDDRPKHELQADRYASMYLVEPREFDEACRATEDMDNVAAELGVTPRLLTAYLGRAS